MRAVALDWRRAPPCSPPSLSLASGGSPSPAAAATAASAATTARACRPAPARRCATSCDAPGAARLSVIDDRRTPCASPDRRRAARRATILLENDLVRVVLDAPDASVTTWRRRGGAILDLAPVGDGAGRPDQRDLPGGRPAAARRRPLREQPPTPLIGGTAAGALRRGRLPRPPGGRTAASPSSPATSCAPASRASACAPISTTARPTRTRSTSPTVCSGATTTPLPFVPGDGARLSRARAGSARHRRAPGGSGRSSPRARRRRPTSPTRSFPAIARTAAGFNNPTLTAAGVPLATTLPGDGIHFERFILAAAGARASRPRSARRCACARWCTASRAPVTVTGRVVAGGTPIDGALGAGGVAAVLRAGVRARPRRSRAPHAVERGGARTRTGASRWRCRRIAATASSRTRSGCRPRPRPRSRSRGRRRRHRRHHADGVRAPDGHGRDGARPADRGRRPTPSWCWSPSTPPRSTREPPSLYGLFPGCDPMLGPPHGGSPACNRALTRDGQLRPADPARALLRLRDARAVRDARPRRDHRSARAARRMLSPLVVESLPTLVAGRRRCRATSTFTAPPASTRRSPTRIAWSASWPRASTSSSRPITTS